MAASNNFTTIRLDRKAKELLDSITPKNRSYGETIQKLCAIAEEAGIAKLYVESIKSSSKYIPLDEIEW